MKIEDIIYMAYLPTEEQMIVITNKYFDGKTTHSYKCNYETYCKKYYDFARLKEKDIKNKLIKVIL